MAQSAYIHIPFCAHKCDFCDFTAFAGLNHLSAEYCRIVCLEIADRIEGLASCRETAPLISIFYGGGTPGLIAPSELGLIQETLKNKISIARDAEITLETTPQAITPEKCEHWLALGINRLSIGVESFNNQELAAIGRGENSAHALAGIETAIKSGFKNISLDFMYGLPDQTLDSWGETLDQALSYGLPHLSAYGLTIATSSPLLSRYPLNSDSYPQEETFEEMYYLLLSKADSCGLKQYEISNFARPGFESRHNWSYWTNDEYLAFGVGAHRYLNSTRSANVRSLARYMKDWLALEFSEEIDSTKRMQEGMFLSLRTCKGICLAEFEQKYGRCLAKEFEAKIDMLADGGLLVLADGYLRLTTRGMLVSNLVMAEFM